MRGGDLARMSSAARRDLFAELLEDVVLPQRQRLLQHRDHTRQSAHVDSDGYLGELLAAIVTGVPGRTRHGKGGDGNDLADGTEVKSSYRLDPNIDFVVVGEVTTVTTPRRERVISIDDLPGELDDPRIRHQVNSNPCSIQLLAENDPATQPVSTVLGRTRSKDALVLGDGAPRLRLGRDAALPDIADGTRVVACFRQERGHINFGARTRAQLQATFARPPILVFHTHDPMGRPLVTVIRVGLTRAQGQRYLDRIFAGGGPSKQVQPYLFPDNTRDRLYDSETHSVAHALRGRVLAVAVGTSQGVRVLHWAPEDPPLVTDLEADLTRVVPPSECADFSHTRIDLDLASEEGRRDAVAAFYESSVKGWYTALAPFCDRAEVTRNMGFGNLAQHLVSLRTGLPGTRSAARGADLVEPDGSISDVKLATGDPREVNHMRSTDAPRLNLGRDQDEITAWRRMFPVRLVEVDDGIHALLHAPSAATMATFRDQVGDYFAARPTSPNLQYHAMDAFPHDRYGVAGRSLTFARVAWLKPAGAHEFAELPPV